MITQNLSRLGRSLRHFYDFLTYTPTRYEVDPEALRAAKQL